MGHPNGYRLCCSMQGALLVFSLKKETSFVSLNYWLEEIHNVRVTVLALFVCVVCVDAPQESMLCTTLCAK